MSEISTNNKRIAKNTLLLYLRMLFLMFVSLYTSRIVLNTLGVEDFGIYNVIGGIVSLFAIANGALSAAVSRFLNIEMGRKNVKALQDVFSSAVSIHVILALFIVVLAEMVGPWFIENKLNIPIERLDSALFVFHCTIITFAINLVTIPYNGCIIAHEDMKIFAYISILEGLSKLLIVYLLVICSFDKLKMYGAMLFVVATFIRIIYQLYCRKNYQECSYNWHFNKDIAKKMFGFSSWNLFGSTSVILADHGVNILLNIFCGPIANAARGIATQVNSAVGQFSNNFVIALNPQITKSYGANDLQRFQKLMFEGSKLTVILLSLLSLPIILNTELVLRIWLKDVPAFSVNFVQLILIFTISEAFSNPFITGLLATGRIKRLMIYVAGTRLMNFPISYFILYYSNVPEYTYIVAIILSQICLFLRLYLLKEYININIRNFYFSSVFKLTATIIASYLVASLIRNELLFVISNILQLIISSLIIDAFFIVVVYNVILDDLEKYKLKSYIIKIKQKYVGI